MSGGKTWTILRLFCLTNVIDLKQMFVEEVSSSSFLASKRFEGKESCGEDVEEWMKDAILHLQSQFVTKC